VPRQPRFPCRCLWCACRRQRACNGGKRNPYRGSWAVLSTPIESGSGRPTTFRVSPRFCFWIADRVRCLLLYCGNNGGDGGEGGGCGWGLLQKSRCRCSCSIDADAHVAAVSILWLDAGSSIDISFRFVSSILDRLRSLPSYFHGILTSHKCCHPVSCNDGCP